MDSFLNPSFSNFYMRYLEENIFKITKKKFVDILIINKFILDNRIEKFITFNIFLNSFQFRNIEQEQCADKKNVDFKLKVYLESTKNGLVINNK